MEEEGWRSLFTYWVTPVVTTILRKMGFVTYPAVSCLHCISARCQYSSFSVGVPPQSSVRQYRP